MSDEILHDMAQRAEKLYAQHLQALLEPAHLGEFVAIEPTSGAYFLGATLSEAIGAARSVYPHQLAYAMRIGHCAAVHLGTGCNTGHVDSLASRRNVHHLARSYALDGGVHLRHQALDVLIAIASGANHHNSHGYSSQVLLVR